MEQAKHDEHRALWAKYVEAIKRDFEILNDEYPEYVQEAYRVLIAFGELVTEPSHSKLTFEEAVFSKIPREKVKWAANILERWTTMDERRAAVREKERERRKANNGRIGQGQSCSLLYPTCSGAELKVDGP